MCGIAGFFHPGGPPLEREVLEGMIAEIAFRGPDHRALYLEGAPGEGKAPERGSVGLAHARLAIIDLDPRANQPMTSGEGRPVIVFNGEIYNFPELRAEREREGDRFSTRSDTEVILACYRRWGLAFADRLRGMFALAIWDPCERRLLLARDRYGIKPLYFLSGGGGMAFASQPRALARLPGYSAAVDGRALASYLVHRYVPDSACIFAGMAKVPPGTVMVWDESGGPRTLCFAPAPSPAGGHRGDPEETAARVERALEESVGRHLVGDVPTGIFLSGGVDSSLIAACAARIQGRGARTITIGFREPGFDEAPAARRVAEFLGTNHREHYVSSPDVLELVEDLPGPFDEPFADSSALPTMLVSRVAREDVKVVLSGDGGDELFYGYRWFPRMVRAWWLTSALPVLLRRPLVRALGRLTGRESELSAYAQAGPAEAFLRFISVFGPGERRDLLLRPGGEETQVRKALERLGARPWPDLLSRLVFETQLRGDFLVKTDRASMWSSLEARVPFLDQEVVDLGFSLPQRAKSSWGVQKRVLRRILERRIPPALVRRPKRGFRVPLAKWLRGDLRPLLIDHLSPEALRKGGLFREGFVERMMREHLEGERDRSLQLWTLLVFEMWRRRYGVEGVSSCP